MKAKIILIALAFAGLTAFLPAQVDDWSRPGPQIDVPYGDLNLTNPAGAQTALRRIKQAASTVCGGYPDLRFATDLYRYRRCVRAATNAAVARLNAPLVVALHTGRPLQSRFAQDNAGFR